ncbi:MAG TPA: hypothetical protein VK157_14345, partial [Phycisphaerales bacterium]|nr:hypothetical protein [Phycisphaerales bacterium]
MRVHRSHVVSAVVAASALMALAGAAAAQTQPAWTVTSLHPPGAGGSVANDVDGEIVVGITFAGSLTMPSLWNVASNVPISLNPNPSQWGAEVAAAGGGQQVGYIDRNEFIPRRYRPRAVLWTGTAESYVDLSTPFPSGGTRAFGVGGGQQVGVTLVDLSTNPDVRATLWSGSTASHVYLHVPAIMFASGADATDGTQQVGSFIKLPSDTSPGVERAALWSGSAASFVNLHPPGAADSRAIAVSNGVQVGNMYPPNSSVPQACMWRGTAASLVILTPPGAVASIVQDTAGGMQIGAVGFADDTGYAVVWSGTPESAFNLSQFLPPGYESALLTGIWTDGNTTRVSGNAYNMNAGGRQEAMIWTRTLCPGVPQCCDDIDFNN